MKRIIFFFAIATVTASCDKIEKPYRVSPSGGFSIDTPNFPALENVIQKYLFEDYTGHTCPNCPEGAAILKSLKTTMKDTLIPMAVHVGTTAKPLSGTGSCVFNADYRTDAGNAYAAEFKVENNPSGMINRIRFGENRVLRGISAWESTIKSIPRTPPTMAIQIIPVHNNDTAYIFIKSTLLSDVSKTLRLCAVLVESNIVSPQKNSSSSLGNVPNICDYTHNHVLRTSISPIWGEKMELSKKDDTQIKAYFLHLAGTSWKKENCHIIAYIYDDDSKEILQTEEAAFLIE
jgi:hypothetical protein